MRCAFLLIRVITNCKITFYNQSLVEGFKLVQQMNRKQYPQVFWVTYCYVILTKNYCRIHLKEIFSYR